MGRGAANEHVILTLNLYYRGKKYHSRGVGETETGKQGDSKKGEATSVERKEGAGLAWREQKEQKLIVKVSVS